MTPLSLSHRVILTRLGGSVERCHTLPHAAGYTNATHSWGVAMLLLQLWPEDFSRLAAYALSHDVPEAWVGDIPAHTKVRLPDLSQQLKALEATVFTRLQLPDENTLPPEDAAKLKAADQLDLWLWAQEELARGNYHAREVKNKLESWWRKNPLPEPATAVWKELDWGRLPNKADVIEDY